MNRPPAIRTISPAVRMILGGVVAVGAAVFLIGMHQPARSPFADVKMSTDRWYEREKIPTPPPPPRTAATPATKPIVVQRAPAMPMPHPQPTICQVCVERQMRFAQAIKTGMGSDMGNTGRGRPAGQPTPNIFAYGGK